MEKGKIKVITLVLLCVVILVVGLIAGFFIGKNIENKNEQQAVVQTPIPGSKTVQNTQIKTNSNNAQENVTNNLTPQIQSQTIKYDGSQSIDINGTSYVISYLSEKFNPDNNYYGGHTELKLYLNDKKISTINLGCIEDVTHYYGSNGYSIELYNICEDYIAILIKAKYSNEDYDGCNYAFICVTNTEGQHIKTFEWNDATSVTDTETGIKLTYKIESDGITTYDIYSEVNKSTAEAFEHKYSIIRDYVKKSTFIKKYTVMLAGK